MIDEKKLAKAAMSDEELENVAGGTFDELKSDANELQRVFGLGGPIRFTYPSGIGNMELVDRSAVVAGFAKLGVRMTFDFDKPNEYFIGGNKVTREEAWDHINAKLDKLDKLNS